MFLFLQSVCESEKVVIAAADGLAPSARSRSSRSVRSSVVAPCRSDCSDTIWMWVKMEDLGDHRC